MSQWAMGAVLMALMAFVQTSPTAQDAAAVQAGKSAIVRTMDASLPALPFEAWLRVIVGEAATMVWSVNDCGEQTGDPARDKDRDFPLCAEVEVTLPGTRVLSVSLGVGPLRTGVSGQPGFRSAYVKASDGSIEWVKNLAAIPGAIRFPTCIAARPLQPYTSPTAMHALSRDWLRG